MDKIYEELEEIKAEAEKLREECRAKTGFSDSLRKAHMEQQDRIQERKLEIEKLAHELQAKSEEICEIRELYEELQSSLDRKEVFVQQITDANEKLRTEYGEKILRLERENRGLVLALDEASARIQDLEKKTASNDGEIAALKRLLSVKPETNVETRTSVSNEMERRDEYILKLEEEIRISQDKMKWKIEQFSHLEEAHKKLQTQFQASKEEWGKEKSALVDEVSSLHSSLDSQVRISESLKAQVRMCDQALAHERSRRKILEIEVSESRSQYESVFQECQLAKSEIEDLTMKRDEELAELRSLLREKEIVANEMKYRTSQLELENKDLLESLKEMQEAQINNRRMSSLEKLRDRIQALEHLHSKCSDKLRRQESDLNSQIEKLKGELEYSLLDLNAKNVSISEVREELEDCKCQLEVKNEEIVVLMMVLKSEFYAAYSMLSDSRENMDMFIKEIVEKNQLVKQELEEKDTKLLEVYGQLKERCDEITVLTEQVRSFDSLLQKNNLLEEKLKLSEAMLDESNECRLSLKQQIQELENSKRQNREGAWDALEKANMELAKKTLEVEKYKVEMEKGKSEVENLKLNLDENQQALTQEKANLLAMSKDQECKIGKLNEQIHVLESIIEAKSESAQMLKEEIYSYKQISEDRKCSVESFRSEFAQLKKELAEKDAEILAVSILSDIKEKDQKILELQEEVEFSKVNLRNAGSSFARKESVLGEPLKRVNDQKFLDDEEKNQIVASLAKRVNDLRKELTLQEETLLLSKQEVLQLDDLLRAKNKEMEVMTSQFEKERRSFECVLEELESHKQSLLEDLKKSSSDRKELLAQLEGICGKMGFFCQDNFELMGILEKMSHVYEEESGPAVSFTSGGSCDAAFSPSTKLAEATADERTPLTELNC